MTTEAPEQTIYAESERTGTSYAVKLSTEDRAKAVAAIATHHREGPAVEIKDRHDWWNDPRTREAFAGLPESIIDNVYEGVRQIFWDHNAPEVAQAHGYAGVYSNGRSAGYVYPKDAPDFLGALDRDDPWTDTGIADDGEHFYDPDRLSETLAERERFLCFAHDILCEVDGAQEFFAEELNDALVALNERREACLVRGTE